MKRISSLLLALAAVSSLATQASAELRPDKVHVADAKKNLSYIRDGLFVGGDKAIDEVVVKDIRRAANPGGYERVVIDLQGTKNGEPAAIPRPPYYQISVTPDEKRIVFTIWGKPKLGFDSRHVVEAFRKSAVVRNVMLLPKVEDNTWTFVFELNGDSPVEVFELSDPVRIIMDIKSSGSAHAAAHHPVAGHPKTHTKGAIKAAHASHSSRPAHPAHPAHDAVEALPAEEAEGALPIEQAMPATEPGTESAPVHGHDDTSEEH